MSTKNQGPVTLDPNTVAAAALFTTTAEKSPPTQNALLELLTEELLRNKTDRQEKERIQQAARDANIADVRKNLLQKQADQEACLHRKPPPSHASALAGQRTHRGTVVFVCQYCQKEFDQTTIPPNLQIPGETIGGPQL